MSTNVRYPALHEFVKCHVVPHELSMMNAVIDVYVYKILEFLEETRADCECPFGMDYLLYKVSPFPEWCPMDAAGTANAASLCFQDNDVVENLKEALEYDDIDFSHIKCDPSKHSE